jgi:hypothetical protein
VSTLDLILAFITAAAAIGTAVFVFLISQIGAQS